MLIIGSYTEPGQGSGAGVSVLETDDDGMLVRVLRTSSGVRNPSFLAVAGGTIYAVEELGDGQVVALDGESLEATSRAPTAGADPCHVLVAEGQVFAANYSSGTAAVLGLDRQGLTGPLQMLSHPGSGPEQDRQEGSHVHQCTTSVRGTILVSDLGADRVDEYANAPDGGYVLTASAELPPGTGPRHKAVRGEELFVVGELDGRLHRCVRDGQSWRWTGAIDLTSTGSAGTGSADGPVPVQPSHVQLSADGRLAYAAIRGRNTIAVVGLGMPGGGETPRLLAEVDCGGDWPRHFAISRAGQRNCLYVANERSGNFAVFTLDADGIPVAAGSFPTGTPTCVVVV